MRNFASSPLIVAIFALAMTAPSNVASAPVGLPDGNGFNMATAGWTVPWRQDGRSYVDDGLRAPLRFTAFQALNDPDWFSAGTLEFDHRANGTSQRGASAAGTGAANRIGAGSSGGGRGANAGLAASGRGGVGGDTGSLVSDGIAASLDGDLPSSDGVSPSLGALSPPLESIAPALGGIAPALGGTGPALGGTAPALGGTAPALNAPTDGLDEVRSSAGSVLPPVGAQDPSETDVVASSLPIIPIPATAALLVAGLGGFVLLMRRRPGRTG